MIGTADKRHPECDSEWCAVDDNGPCPCCKPLLKRDADMTAGGVECPECNGTGKEYRGFDSYSYRCVCCEGSGTTTPDSLLGFRIGRHQGFIAEEQRRVKGLEIEIKSRRERIEKLERELADLKSNDGGSGTPEVSDGQG